jgi:hypothetical protein
MSTHPIRHPIRFALRKAITFEQAEGVEPLPRQLKLKEISPLLRATLWDMVLESIEESTHRDSFVGTYIDGPWHDILLDRHIFRLHKMRNDFINSFKTNRDELQLLFETGDYVQVFGFLQTVIRHPRCPPRFAEQVDETLKHARAAYRVVDKTIMPIGSVAELGAIKQAFADLAAAEFNGARAHLGKASEELTAGRYGDSIRESIHAVEATARVLAAGASGLSSALDRLESKLKIHRALKHGFGNLYGYSSDEKGIRHPLLDDGTAKVDETDALFMIGACAAFVSYLINKARTASLLGTKS